MSTISGPVRAPWTGTIPPALRSTPGFLGFIADGWADADAAPPVVDGAPAAAAAHRERLAERLGGRTVLVAAGTAPVRSNDTRFDFRADSDFWWLTGCAVEEGMLLLSGRADTLEAELFLPAPAGPGETAFFADAAHGELWNGPVPSLPSWQRALGVRVRPLDELEDVLGRAGEVLAGRLVPTTLLAAHPGLVRSTELDRHCADLRMVKDAWEVAQLREAVDHTVTGFAAVVAEVPRAVAGPGERWLQGTFDRHARAFGNAPGYATIVGSGPHAPTLHWVRADGPVLAEEVLLLDMGVEARSGYTADVTRTVPASGTFSPTQRAVHDLVETAHRAGLAQVVPGHRFSDFHFACMEVVAQGLHDWGLLPVSVDEALSPQGQQHRRWLVCGVGHHLGLDVHDCAASHTDQSRDAPLVEGMALTVEPGLYFHAHDTLVPPELRGIGVRLEDDLVVTATGADVLSDGLPIDAAGVERWTQQALTRPA